MQCGGVQKQLSDYLDGRLDRAHRDAVDRHLRACAPCRAELETLRQTVALLHDLEEVAPPPEVRAQLARKIRAVRQPLTWSEGLRLRWRANGLAVQARQWAVGVAASVLLFTAGGLSMQQWNTRAQPLAVVPGGSSQPAAVSSSRSQGVRLLVFPQTPMVVGQQATLYLYLEPERDLSNVGIYLRPAAGIKVAAGTRWQGDATYLVRQGPLLRGNSRTQWVPVELYPQVAGEHALRIAIRYGDQVLAEENVRIVVAPAAR